MLSNYALSPYAVPYYSFQKFLWATIQVRRNAEGIMHFHILFSIFYLETQREGTNTCQVFLQPLLLAGESVHTVCVGLIPAAGSEVLLAYYILLCLELWTSLTRRHMAAVVCPWPTAKPLPSHSLTLPSGMGETIRKAKVRKTHGLR